MAARDRATAIFAAEAMRVRASVAAMPPRVAVPTVAVLGAGGSEMPNLVAGAATRPGLEVPRAVSTNMAHMATHGAKVVHVNDWGGGGTRRGVLQLGGSRAEGELEERSGGVRANSVLDQGDIDGQRGRGADGVRGGGLSWTLIRSVVRLPAEGAGGRGGLALSLVLLLVLSSVRWDRNGA